MCERHTKDTLSSVSLVNRECVEVCRLDELTPKRYQSNVPSPSSGESSLSAFGSRRQTLSSGMPLCFISSSTPSLCADALAKACGSPASGWSRPSGAAPVSVTNSSGVGVAFVGLSRTSARAAEDEAEREVKWTAASRPASIRMCYEWIGNLMRKDILGEINGRGIRVGPILGELLVHAPRRLPYVLHVVLITAFDPHFRQITNDIIERHVEREKEKEKS